MLWDVTLVELEARFPIIKYIWLTMYYKYLPPDRFDVMCNLKIRFTQPGALNKSGDEGKVGSLKRE